MRTALIDFDPSAATSGVLNVGSLDYASNLGMVNDSQIDLTLQFADGSTDVLKANANRVFPLSQPTKTINWQQRNILSTAAPSISIVSAVLMDSTEDPAIWRMDSTVRQVNINNLYGALNQITGFFYVTYTLTGGTGNHPFTINNPSKKNVYLLGWDFSADPATSGVVEYQVKFSNINTDANTASHVCTATTTQAASMMKSYPSPGLPVINDGDPLKGAYAIVSGTTTGQTLWLNIYGIFA